MSKLIQPKWLHENKNNFLILDCRFKLSDANYGLDSYKKEHIENAVFINFEKELAGEIKEHGGRHPLPDMFEFSKNMESHGISDSTDIVIYDDGDLAGASRLWWMFRYIGKNNVYVLDGGLTAWKNEGYETTDSETMTTNSIGKLTVKIQNDILCDMEYVKSKLSDKNTVIVDSRANERYLGLTEPMDRIPGHVPSAVNFPYGEAIKDGHIISNEKLSDRFSSLGNGEKEIIIYCGSGVTGSVNFLLMEEVGLKPVLYAGSYSDWTSYLDNKVETK